MLSVVSRSAAAISRTIIAILIGTILSAAWNADRACAKPMALVLPKPYIMNRGDGDTINGRYFTYDSSDGGDALSSPRALSPADYNENEVPKDVNRRIKALRWIILYHLIR